MDETPANLRDEYKWAKETVQVLRAGNLAALDMAALLDEIESVYTGLERQLANGIEDLLAGKLSQDEPRVARALIQLSILFSSAPSIREALTEEMIDEGYQWIRSRMQRDPSIQLPERCPYTRD